MNDFKNVLLAHAGSYPLIQPEDAVKLVYQATFGGGHLISDEAAVISRLTDEYRNTDHTNAGFRCESLGKTARLYLDCEFSHCELEAIARIFIASAKGFSAGYNNADEKTKELFCARLSLLTSLCRDGVFAFSASELEAYLRKYRNAGCPAVSHSEAYRNAYKPAYRVIDSRYVRLLPTIFETAKRLQESKHTVIAIDGRAASGKTTAAELISRIFPSETIHMDHFFLPASLRTKERLDEAGGNIHRERFICEVLPGLRSDEGFSYKVFDCSRFDYADEPRRILPAPLYIVEGSYAFHPAFGNYYDIAFFSDVSSEEQQQRILKRNGAAMLERFNSTWIPMEEKYFASIGHKR